MPSSQGMASVLATPNVLQSNSKHRHFLKHQGLPSHSPCHWGKVSWVVNSVRLVLPFTDRRKPGRVSGDGQFPNEAKNILKWLQLWFGDLILRDATELFNFLSFPNIEKESSWWVTSINGVLNPVCCGSCLSFSHSESKGNYQANSGEETVWPLFSCHFYYQTSALASWGSRLLLCLVCMYWRWRRENIYRAQTLGIFLIIRR